jgi:hypothetical protein
MNSLYSEGASPSRSISSIRKSPELAIATLIRSGEATPRWRKSSGSRFEK